jgi:hypothetical protein
MIDKILDLFHNISMNIKKQLQKCFFLFLLSGCMVAPINHFGSYFKVDQKYHLPVQKITLVSNLKKFDSTHHIENKLSLSPYQIVQNWINNTFIIGKSDSDLHLILNKAEIVREEFPAQHWWQPDMVQDTLNYDIELVQRKNGTSPYRLKVGGKHYAKMNKKTSLAEKEKQYAKLYDQMLNHILNEMQNNIPHVVPVSSQD